MQDTLDPQHTALLFFDMLKSYAYEPDLRTLLPEARSQVEACVRIMGVAREVGAPVFYAQADHRPDGRDRARPVTDLEVAPRDLGGQEPGRRIVSGSEAAQIIDELAPQAGDYVIRKHRWSAFFQTELELSLRARAIDTLLLAGGSTEVGVASTAYAARDLDFSVVILRECVRSGRGREVSDFFLNQVFPRLARIRGVDEAIALLRSRPGP